MGEEFRCYVGNLSWNTNDDRLEQAFRPFGEVVQCKVVMDAESGRSRGFGFVTFADENSMNEAINEMNEQELDGRRIKVNRAQTRSDGGDGGGYVAGGYGAGGGRS